MELDNEYKMKLQTHEQLQLVWDEIGTSKEEREVYLTELSDHVQALYNSHLQEQKVARNAYKEKVRSLQTSIQALCEQLQIEVMGAVSASVPLLEQITSLTAQLDAVKQERDRQQVRNGKALAELAELYEVLGEPLPDTHHLQLGAHRLGEIQILVVQTRQKIADKKVLLEAARNKVYTELQGLMFEEDEYTELDRLVLIEGSEIPLSALNEVVHRGVELEEIDAARKEKLKALARKIASIWNILNVPAEHRQEFMAGNAGLGRATFEKCEQELAEMEAKKRVQLPRLLEECEIRLRELWTETCTSQREQDNFFESYVEMNNELKFTAIKQQIVDVEKKLEQMQPLLTSVKKREQVKADEEAYSALQNDPNRFKVPGLPLRLEKMRQSFHSFSKLATKLKQELEEWEAANGPFMRNGERLLSVMEANGEFVEGYVPGAAEARRTITSKADPNSATPRKPARSTTIPRTGRATPSKRDENKHYSSQSLPCALNHTPSKKETPSNVSTAKKRIITGIPSARKIDRENHAESQPRVPDSKQREKPSHDHFTPKRIRTPFKESNR